MAYADILNKGKIKVLGRVNSTVKHNFLSATGAKCLFFFLFCFFQSISPRVPILSISTRDVLTKVGGISACLGEF